MHILGISCFFHDSAAALLRDGVLVAAAEEERFSRKKHDFDFPEHAINFCLRAGGLRSEELDYVVFFEKPFAKFERLILSSLQTFPLSQAVFSEAMISWLGDKLWIKQILQRHLGVSGDKILFSEHHLSHAASTFFCSPYEEAAILTVDGVGEWATASIGVGKGNDIRLLEEIRFPHSLGLLYSAFTAFLGFEVNEGEYKVMGMAGYGTPRYVDEVRRVVRFSQDGSFELDLSYFCFQHSLSRTYSQKFVDLFGPPRDLSIPFFTAAGGYPSYFGQKAPDGQEAREYENQHYADIAASVQAVTEEVMVRMAQHAFELTGLKRLCLAGGVALNSVANTKILSATPFDDIYIQPAAGDGGGALGAALFAWHMALGKPRCFVMQHAFWGEEHEQAEIGKLLEEQGVRYRYFNDPQDLLDYVVGQLQEGKVTGWCQGRFEWGPRALGHRSILADPRPPGMKDIVNSKIKSREPFRPFAPSVLAECAGKFFDLPRGIAQYPSRFMLYVAKVREDQQQSVPAITHVDGTARLQTVARSEDPLYYDLIRRFGEATGVPMLLNTSFNLKGEPIVNTPTESLKTFQACGMDMLVLGQFVVEKA